MLQNDGADASLPPDPTSFRDHMAMVNNPVSVPLVSGEAGDESAEMEITSLPSEDSPPPHRGVPVAVEIPGVFAPVEAEMERTPSNAKFKPPPR
jgi:hypothetical protein